MEVQSASAVVAPTGSQNKDGGAGKRPSGTKLTSEPPSMVAAAHAVIETQRAKKGLPFLKNSMSGLLLRRKASQNAPDLQSLPLPYQPGEAAYQPIRGTKVHDFSAPRTKPLPKRQNTAPVPELQPASSGGPQVERVQCPVDLPLRTDPTVNNSRVVPNASLAELSESHPNSQRGLSEAPSTATLRQARKVSVDDKSLSSEPPASTSATDVVTATSPRPSMSAKSRSTSTASSMKQINPSITSHKSRHLSQSDDAMLRSAVPRHMKSNSSRFSFDLMGTNEAAVTEKLLEERHRQRELEKKANREPDHRDSRYDDDLDDDAFDYDAAMMDDGLEEDVPEVNDDYDENDFIQEEIPLKEERLKENIPLEEDLPMIEEDIMAEEDDEDQDDPDNDQENFAGFVFTRSSPHSNLGSPATPGMLSTPLDSIGRPIGYAFTKDGTPVLGSSTSTLPDEEESPNKQDANISLAGLGIQSLSSPAKTQYDPKVFQERRNLPPIEDVASGPEKGLYYDGGLLDELQMQANEFEASTFDEDLFDLDDVDKFGRPLPGVFRQNLELRNKADGHEQRGSDITPPRSAASATSTADSSVSAGPQLNSSSEDTLAATGVPFLSTREVIETATLQLDTAASTSPSTPHDAYQQALVDGVRNVPASKWTSRWDNDDGDDVEGESEVEREFEVEINADNEAEIPESSPNRDYDFTITSPTTASPPSTAGLQGMKVQQIDDHVDNSYLDDDACFDDDDYFDDDFIAEANAEALAYDDDGFYGTEFGFYSAPPAARPASSSNSDAQQPTSSSSLFGGYFGPSNIVSRTLSGRVLREPNLTPITEMSEPAQWSNRNSTMSMGLPSAALSDFRGSILSPGLAHMGGGGEPHDFTLGNLQQLRYKTFGGSQISLSSSRDGSPRSEREPMHSERFESLSPMPWDFNRPLSHLGIGSVPSPRQFDTGSPYSPGVPSQPLTSPPSIPRSAYPSVKEVEGESTRVVPIKQNNSVVGDAELSPSGTFGTADEGSLRSFHTAIESPASFFSPVEGPGKQNAAAFEVNSQSRGAEERNGAGGTDAVLGVDTTTRSMLLRGPCSTDTLNSSVSRETLRAGDSRDAF